MSTRDLIARLMELNKEAKKLPELTQEELRLVKADIQIDSVHSSQKLEGGTLSREETKQAVLSKNDKDGESGD